jgi:putative tryptophan/tyrosine transport system substrate-binding protein
VEALVITITLTLDGVVLEAQQPEKVHRIGLLIAASNVIAPLIDAFRQGLRELGYVEGNNYILEIRGGGAKADRLFDLAAELVRLEVKVIVAVGSPALRAATKATSTTPIVMRTGGRSGKGRSDR